MTLVSSTTKSTEKALSELYLAADLGKSACKFCYWKPGTTSENLAPLWLSSEVVVGANPAIVKTLESLQGEPSETTWLKVGEEIILVGNAAAGYGTSFKADKAQVAVYQIAAALGLAAIRQTLSHYHAQVAIALPLSEFGSRFEIAAKLQDIGSGYIFCGRTQKFHLTTSFYPEGSGLFTLHKQQQEAQAGTAYQRRVVVLMLGHRNISVLVFEHGKLKSTLSQTSDDLGFWQNFRAAATSVSICEADYDSLMSALYSNKPRQLSPVAGGIKDFSAGMSVVKSSLMQKLEPFCRDNVIKLLLDGSTDIVIGGGVAYLLRAELHAYFAELGLQESVFFADATAGNLLSLANQLPRQSGDLAFPARLADVYGVAQVLFTRMGKQHG